MKSACEDILPAVTTKGSSRQFTEGETSRQEVSTEKGIKDKNN